MKNGLAQSTINDILHTLGIIPMDAGANPGATSGSSAGWIETEGPELVSYSPVNGQPLARIRTARREDYETLMKRAQEAFNTFRMTPAPKRGEMVREIGNALREKKDLVR